MCPPEDHAGIQEQGCNEQIGPQRASLALSDVLTREEMRYFPFLASLLRSLKGLKNIRHA
jgi:hypothetical protein